MKDGHPARRAILIAGPTASGKSALALALAEEIGGTVINADSMQVYADLRILTARPSEVEMARAPHRLFGHVEAAESYSVGRWLDDVRAALDEAWSAGRMPILVGGTGLYVSALMKGLSAIPAIPDPVRARLRAQAASLSAGELHARLRSVDPVMAGRLRPSDPQRILRALEVHEATGRSLSAWQEWRDPPLLSEGEIAAAFLDLPRAELFDRINLRVARMIDEGALAEARALGLRNLPSDNAAMRALGVAPLIAADAGRLPIDLATAQVQAATRQYAKRQITYARHQWPTMPWKPAGEASAWLRAVGTKT